MDGMIWGIAVSTASQLGGLCGETWRGGESGLCRKLNWPKGLLSKKEATRVWGFFDALLPHGRQVERSWRRGRRGWNAYLRSTSGLLPLRHSGQLLNPLHLIIDDQRTQLFLQPTPQQSCNPNQLYHPLNPPSSAETA